MSGGELIGRGIVAPGRSSAPLGGSTPVREMAVGAAEVHVDEETGAVMQGLAHTLRARRAP
jgi:hypothetical protein